jgi:hypothetical protein
MMALPRQQEQIPKFLQERVTSPPLDCQPFSLCHAKRAADGSSLHLPLKIIDGGPKIKLMEAEGSALFESWPPFRDV